MTRSDLQTELQQTKPFSSLEEEAVLNLMRSYDCVNRELSRFFREHGTSEPQYNVMRILRGAGPDGLPSLEIANRMLFRTPDITRLIDRLEAAGWAERQRTEEDRRVVRVRLTARGQRFLGSLDEPIRAFHLEQIGHMSREELGELIRLLEKARTKPSTSS